MLERKMWAVMVDIPESGEIVKLTGVLAPGIIILWIRSRFRDAVPATISDKIASYAIISVAYSAIAYPIFHADDWVELPYWLWLFLLNFGLPLISAGIMVFFDHSERFYALTNRLGLRPVHHMPTAWDFTFRRRAASYVLVHLTDGSEVAGAWVKDSFASSTVGDRDVYISQMWAVKDGKWTVLEPQRSILICGGAIRMIEFIAGGSE